MTPAAPIRIGWLAAFQDGPATTSLLGRQIDTVGSILAASFPQITWQHMQLPPAPAGEVRTAPLPWLEHAATEKLLHGCDFVLVLTDALLDSRDRGFAYGAVSRELESLVVSLRPFLAEEPSRSGYRENGLAALLLYGLSLLFGADEDPGRLNAVDWREATPMAYAEALVADVGPHLEALAAPRAEEERGSETWSGARFLLRALHAEAGGIAAEALANRPWTMPLALGRYTAATAVTLVFLFFSSDVWIFVTHLRPAPLLPVALLVTLGGALSLYFGHNFHTLARISGRREQLVRTRAIVLASLAIGLLSLWCILFLLALLLAASMPAALVREWSGIQPGADLLVTFSLFAATLGVLAATFGGNLEDEQEIKSLLLVDREF